VIATQARDPGGGLIVMPSAFNVINRELISALAVPAIAAFRSFADSGGLYAKYDFRRIATRYDRLAQNYLASVCLAAVLVWWI
jgi:hypothetical protein